MNTENQHTNEVQGNSEPQSPAPEESKPLKPGVLRADIWEDVAICYAIAKAGGNDDESCRVHAEIDQQTGQAKIRWVGTDRSIDKVRRALKADVVEHEEMRIDSYPGEENFPIEKAKEIALPFIVRTMEMERQRLGLHEPAKKLETHLLEFKETIDLGLKQLFGIKD